MRYIILLLLIIPIAASSQQIWKGTGIAYTRNTPTYNPGPTGAWVAIDTTSGDWYEWQTASNSWRLMGERLQFTGTYGTPAYTPGKQLSSFAVNLGDSLFAYQAGSWVLLNPGAGASYNTAMTYANDTLSLIDGGGTLKARIPAGYNTSFTVSNDTFRITDGGGTLSAKVPPPLAGTNIEVNGRTVSLDTLGLITFKDTLPRPLNPGQLAWNSTDQTLDIKLNNNVTLQTGQEFVVRVVNKSGTNLTQAGYQCVYVSEAQGQRLAVKLADADFKETAKSIIGIATESISVNQEGFVTLQGLVRGINTTGSLQGQTWADGDVLFLDTIAGGLTNVLRPAPNHKVKIGYVAHAHANNGMIFVNSDSGTDLEEICNVKLTSPTNGQTLLYNAVDSVWYNGTVAGSGISYADTLTLIATQNYVNTRGFLTAEVDGSVTNELQTIDTFTIVSDTMRLSLSSDGQPFKAVSLRGYVDTATYLVQDTILRYLVRGVEVGRDTISPASSSGATSLSFTGTSNVITLNSSTGADVNFAQGTGINLTRSNDTMTIANSLPDVTVSLTGGGINSVTGTYPNFTITGTEVDGSTTNEIQTLTNSLNVLTLSNGGGTVSILGGGINTTSFGTGSITITGTEVDGSITNEGTLGVGAGGANTSLISSNTSGATGVTVSGGTGISISESTSSNGGTITITNSSPDQTVSLTGGGINVVTGTYPSFTITGTEVDGSVANEIQSIDTLRVNGTNLEMSLSSDGIPARTLPISNIIGNGTDNYYSVFTAADTLKAGIIKDTAGMAMFKGLIAMGETANYPRFGNISSSGSFSLDGRGLMFYTFPGSQTSSYDSWFRFQSFGSYGPTTGETGFLRTIGTFNPSSGTAVYNTFFDGNTINQTGTANGITRSFFASPTLTSAIDHRSFETGTNGEIAFSSTGTSDSRHAGSFRIGQHAAPLRTLDVTGTLRASANVDTASLTRIWAGNTQGDLRRLKLGSNLSIANDTLNATGGSGSTDLTFTGSAGVYTLASSTGTDVYFKQGTGITLTESGDTLLVTNASPDQTVALTGGGITSISGTYPNFTITSTEVDGSTSNELQTISNTLNVISLSNGGGTITIAGGGINTITTGSGLITVVGTEVDGSVSNEGTLGVGAGGANTSLISSNTSGATGVTISGGTGVTISESTSTNGGTITITNSSPDQTVSLTGAGINVVTGTYPNFTITGTEVDGSTSNELQTLSLAADKTTLSITNGNTITIPFDTITIATFGGGSGATRDTSIFSTSAIYGSFYHDGNDTLIITEMQIGLQGTTPSVVATVIYNDSLNVTGTPLVTAGTTATNTAGGTNVTSFNNNKIPPGNWVWAKTTTVTTKPTYMSITIVGYRKRKV